MSFGVYSNEDSVVILGHKVFFYDTNTNKSF